VLNIRTNWSIHPISDTSCHVINDDIQSLVFNVLLGGVFKRVPELPGFSYCSSQLTVSILSTQALARLLYTDCSQVKVNVMLRPTINWPVYLGVRHPSHLEPMTKFVLLSASCVFIDVGRPLMEGWLCSLQLLLGLANAVILRVQVESLGSLLLVTHPLHGPHRKYLSQQLFYCCMM
jgi:hypothetical protein